MVQCFKIGHIVYIDLSWPLSLHHSILPLPNLEYDRLRIKINYEIEPDKGSPLVMLSSMRYQPELFLAVTEKPNLK